LTRFEDLPPHQRLNVWADFLAKRELHWIASLPVPIQFPPSLHGEKWSAYLHDQKLVSDPYPSHRFLGSGSGFTILGAEGPLVASVLSAGSVGYFTCCYLCYPSTFQMWLSKFALGHSAVGITMFH